MWFQYRWALYRETGVTKLREAIVYLVWVFTIEVPRAEFIVAFGTRGGLVQSAEWARQKYHQL